MRLSDNRISDSDQFDKFTRRHFVRKSSANRQLAEHRNARCGTRKEAAAKQLTRTGRHIYREVTAVQTPCSLAFDYDSTVVLSPSQGGDNALCVHHVCMHVCVYICTRWCPIKCLRRFRLRRATTNVVERVSNPFGVQFEAQCRTASSSTRVA